MRKGLTISLIVLFFAISSISYGQEKRMGSFSGSWNTSFTEQGIRASGGGDIKITVFPEEGYFKCKVSGSVGGSAKKGKKSVKVHSSMYSSGCRGTYIPETGSIDGGFTANESGSYTLTMPNKKEIPKKISQMWPGSIYGSIKESGGSVVRGQMMKAIRLLGRSLEVLKAAKKM